MEHSKKCLKISKLKQELIAINNWLIKECENASQLNNNIGFDLLIAKNVAKGKASSAQSRQDAENLQKENSSTDQATEKAKQTDPKPVGSNPLAFKNRRCTTSDFKKFTELQSANDSASRELQISSFSGTGTLTQPHHDCSKSESHAFEQASIQSIGSTGSHDGSPRIERSDKLEQTESFKYKSSLIKPSHFREKYKKPSGSQELNRLSSDSRTIGHKEGSGDSKQDQSKQELKEDSSSEDCVADKLFEDEEQEDPLDHRKLKPLPTISEDIKEARGLDGPLIQNILTSTKLEDPPEGIMNLLSDDEDDEENSSEKPVGSNPPSKFFFLNKTQEFPIKPKKEEALPQVLATSLSQAELPPFKHAVSRSINGKSEPVDTENNSNKEHASSQISDLKPPTQFDGVSPGPTGQFAGLFLQTDASPEDRPKPVSPSKGFEMSKFKEMSKMKGFKTQVFESKVIKPENPSHSPNQQDLTRDVQMAKTCKKFFERMIK